jgi:hypothetical protein
MNTVSLVMAWPRVVPTGMIVATIAAPSIIAVAVLRSSGSR